MAKENVDLYLLLLWFTFYQILQTCWHNPLSISFFDLASGFKSWGGNGDELQDGAQGVCRNSFDSSTLKALLLTGGSPIWLCLGDPRGWCAKDMLVGVTSWWLWTQDMEKLNLAPNVEADIFHAFRRKHIADNVDRKWYQYYKINKINIQYKHSRRSVAAARTKTKDFPDFVLPLVMWCWVYQNHVFTAFLHYNKKHWYLPRVLVSNVEGKQNITIYWPSLKHVYRYLQGLVQHAPKTSINHFQFSKLTRKITGFAELR